MPIITDSNINQDPLPSRIGSGSSYAEFGADGTLRIYGEGTTWEDLRVDAMNTRVGIVAPTDEVGFRGNSNHQMRSMVHTQADEVQINVQLPHAYAEGTDLHPHVYFSPEIAGSGNNQASFILEYYPAAYTAIFPATTASILMTASWNGDKQWHHLIAREQGAISGSDLGISALLKCRLYRDNTGACNLQGKVAFLYFDIHYIVDSMGSREEYSK